ncbi:trypsin-like peptidase domain-containing protein [bacterium]|nr:trypsin-like peptidase domain-containing protein [bacterium]
MLRIKKLALNIIIFFQLFTPVVFSFDADEARVIQIYEKIYPTIVSIDAQSPYGISSGTGCIISSNGGILTSSHVIDKSKDIDVTLNNGKVYKAKVVSVMNNDLALLKINANENLKTIELGNSETVKVGQKVLAIGNPFGFSGTLTKGIVSRIDYAKNKIQTDAAINPGNSGGPIINSSGEVIGISQSIYNPDNNKSNIGIGFAVPVNSAKDFIKQCKAKHIL